jgi:uncharacterized protein with PQ loop repeat
MIAALGFFSAALSISVVWPQVWRSCRHGRTLGLSPTTSWLAVGLNLCWLTFGLLTGDAAQVITHVVVGVGNTAVLAALLRAHPHLRRGPMLLRTAAGAWALAALAAGSALSVVLLAADPAAVATGLSAMTSLVAAAAAVPQPMSLLLDPAQDISGLSPARWRLGAGSCASWMGYGWFVGEPVVWMSAGFGLACAVLMCALLRARPTAGVRAPLRAVPGSRLPVRPALVAA